MDNDYRKVHSAEHSVIGCLLIDFSTIREICDNLKPEMFRTPILGNMYLEFLRAYDRHQKMDIVLLVERMKEAGHDPETVSYGLRACMDQVGTSVLIQQYAQTVINAHKARELGKLIQDVQNSPEEIHTKIGQMITALEALREGETTSVKNLAQIVAENKQNYFRKRKETWLRTGFEKLDDSIRLKGGDVIVIGARPGVGKSAFVTQMALSFSRQGKRVGFFNLEMQEDQVYERFISSLSGIGIRRLQRAENYLGEEEQRFLEANELLEKQPIFLSTGSKSVSQIRSESRYMDFDVIIVDYLQLVKADVRYQNRASEVGDVSKAVKALAMELNVPVIALSQLNRVSEMKHTKEPTMAELREAGDIEQDASIIILMWNMTEDRKKKGLKVDKNRQGEECKIVLRFNGNLMRFEETKETVKESSGWSNAQENPFD